MRVLDKDRLAPSPEPPELRRERRRRETDEPDTAGSPRDEREIGEHQGGGIPGALGGGQSGQGGG